MNIFFNILAASTKGVAQVDAPIGTSNPFVFESTDYIHIITNGQSLSTGSETVPALSNVQISDNVMIGDSDRIDLTNDLTTFNALALTSIQAEAIATPLTNALKTKVLSEFATHPLATKTLLATTTGTGGRTVSQLTGIDYPKFTSGITSAKNIVDGLSKTISCPFIVYMQGETEDSADTATYKTNLLAHFNKMRNDVKAMYGQVELPTIVVYQPKTPDDSYVSTAYYELADEYSWIVQAGNVYSVPNRGIHLDSNGSRWYGETLAKVVFQSIKTGEKFEPLKPISAEIVGNNVVVTYNRDVVFDEVSRPNQAPNLKGFQLSYNAQQSISIQNGNQVVIVSNKADLRVYADSLSEFGVGYKNGALRDTDDYIATTIYEDYGDDGLVVNQTYDDLGNIIYGDTYPMWNWSMEYGIFDL